MRIRLLGQIQAIDGEAIAPTQRRVVAGRVHTIGPWLSWWFVSERAAIGIAQNVSVDGRGGR